MFSADAVAEETEGQAEEDWEQMLLRLLVSTGSPGGLVSPLGREEALGPEREKRGRLSLCSKLAWSCPLVEGGSWNNVGGSSPLEVPLRSLEAG